MAKIFNRFIIDTSGKGKFSDHIVIHTKTPKFIAKAILIPNDKAMLELEKIKDLPMGDVAYSYKQLSSGKYLVLVLLELWDYVEGSESARKDLVTALNLGREAYITRMFSDISEANIAYDELTECIEYLNTQLRNSELCYYQERHNYNEEMRVAYQENLTMLRTIRQHLRTRCEQQGILADKI